jgi:hypothetical protein
MRSKSVTSDVKPQMQEERSATSGIPPVFGPLYDRLYRINWVVAGDMKIGSVL